MNIKPVIICHRINTTRQLLNTPKKYGVEIDIRTFNNEIILHHDPLRKGEKFREWLKKFDHNFLILNIKEEGLEKYVITMLKKNNIKKFFFLDQSFPFLIKTLKTKEKRCAVRFSEFEDINTAYRISSMINWIWVDYFTKFPLNKKIATTLNKKKIKICIVSPELVKKISKRQILDFKNYIQKKKIHIDAVCTKKPELWSK